jgi:uncharacterized protein
VTAMLMRALYRLLRPKYGTGSVRLGGRTIKVHLADSFAAMMFGLMYWERLEKGRGMLFTLGRESRISAGIWMLNVKFPIDIVWMDSSGSVVDVKEKAKPCTSFFRCKTHVPRSKAKYVLELNAGSARKLGIRIGNRIDVGNAS